MNGVASIKCANNSKSNFESLFAQGPDTMKHTDSITRTLEFISKHHHIYLENICCICEFDYMSITALTLTWLFSCAVTTAATVVCSTYSNDYQ